MLDEGMSKCGPLIRAAVATATTRGHTNKQQTTRARHAPVCSYMLTPTLHWSKQASKQESRTGL